MNEQQRRHVANGLQAVALGELLYFGFAALSNGDFFLFLAALGGAVYMECMALLVLEDQDEE